MREQTEARADTRETVARWFCANWLGDDALWDVFDAGQKADDYDRADRLLAVLEHAGLVIVAKEEVME